MRKRRLGEILGTNFKWYYANEYVHYGLTQAEINRYSKPWQVYQDKSNAIKANYALQLYDERLQAKYLGAKNYEQQYKDAIEFMLNDGGELKNVVNLMNNLLTSMDISIFTAAYKSIKGQDEDDSSYINRLQQEISNFSDQLTTLLSQLETLIETNEISTQTITVKNQVIQIDDLTRYLRESDKVQSGWKHIKEELNGLNSKGIGVDNLQSVFEAISTKQKNSPIIKAYASLFNKIGLLVGNVSEFLGEAIGKQLVSEFVETIRTGDMKGEILQKRTSDIAISKKILGNGFNLQVPVGGVSLKRSYHKGGLSKTIHVKKTNFGKLWGLSKGSTLSQHHQLSFYNFYLNIGQKFQNPAIPKGTVNKMYNILTQIFLGPALAGEMNDKDFAFLLVYNNNIFTIRDILISAGQSINNQGNMTDITWRSGGNPIRKAQSTSLQYNTWYGKKGVKNQEEAIIRSQMAISALEQTEIDMSLRIHLNKLTNLA